MLIFKGVFRGLLGTAALMGLCFLAACHKGDEAKSVAPGTITVEVSPPEQRTIPFFETFPARIEAVDSVDIRARVSGYLWSVDFTPGANIKKNQVLFHIDERPYKAALERIQADLEGQQARLRRATLDLNRDTKLIASKTISQEEYDRSFAAKLEAQAAVDAASAQLRIANLNVEWTKVTAPLDGRISRNYISVGNLVTADATLLTTLESDANVYAYFQVDENSWLNFQELVRSGKIELVGRDQARIELLLPPNNSVYPQSGTWNFIDVRMDPGTGTLEFRAKFPNPEVTLKNAAASLPSGKEVSSSKDSPHPSPPPKGEGTEGAKVGRLLISGMFCRVRVPTCKPLPVLLVPDDAVRSDQDKKFLYLVDKDNKVEYRQVQIGDTYDKTYRVIEDGLKPGDRVIISGIQRVRPKMTVNPMTPKEMKLK
jgi:RND family efflux transporter MFP subunit